MESNTRAIIERKIGYRFNNPDLLRQAFVRKSYANEHGGQHNEVLEHFGDAALNFAVKRYLFERYGSWTELSKNYNYRIDRNEFVSLLLNTFVFSKINLPLLIAIIFIEHEPLFDLSTIPKLESLADISSFKSSFATNKLHSGVQSF